MNASSKKASGARGEFGGARAQKPSEQNPPPKCQRNDSKNRKGKAVPATSSSSMLPGSALSNRVSPRLVLGAVPAAAAEHAVSTTSFCGVHWDEDNEPGSQWRADITIRGEQKILGYFGMEDEAARRYDEKAAELGRPLNFPKPSVVKTASPAGRSRSSSLASSDDDVSLGSLVERQSAAGKPAAKKGRSRSSVTGLLETVDTGASSAALSSHMRFCDGKRWRCGWCACKTDECSGKGAGPEGASTLCRNCSKRFQRGATEPPKTDKSGNFLAPAKKKSISGPIDANDAVAENVDGGKWRCGWCECTTDRCNGKSTGPKGPSSLCHSCSKRFRNGSTGPLKRDQSDAEEFDPKNPSTSLDTWVQCDGCAKWRNLGCCDPSALICINTSGEVAVPGGEPTKWFCSMLADSDPAHSNCAAPEESYPSSRAAAKKRPRKTVSYRVEHSGSISTVAEAMTALKAVADGVDVPAMLRSLRVAFNRENPSKMIGIGNVVTWKSSARAPPSAVPPHSAPVCVRSRGSSSAAEGPRIERSSVAAEGWPPAGPRTEEVAVGRVTAPGARSRSPAAERPLAARWARYEAYKAAKTVGEALGLGATVKDLVDDLTRDRVVIVIDISASDGTSSSSSTVVRALSSDRATHLSTFTSDDDADGGVLSKGPNAASTFLSSESRSRILEGCAKFRSLDAGHWFLEKEVRTAHHI